MKERSCGVLVSCVSVGWGLEQLPGPRGKERLERLRGKEVGLGLGLGLGGGKVKVRMQGLGLDKGKRLGWEGLKVPGGGELLHLWDLRWVAVNT